MKLKYKKFSLIQPFRFQTVYVDTPAPGPHEVLVRILAFSICNADLRYYSGKRRKADLKKKLPMALVHEGIGRIIAAGDPKSPLLNKRAILIPNIPCWLINQSPKSSCHICSHVGENYCSNSIFLSSGHDGFTQEMIILPVYNILPIPDTIPDDIAVLSELLAVINNLYRRLSISPDSSLLIFGDGPIAYLVASFFSYIAKIPPQNLYVAGLDPAKLAHFSFCTTIASNPKILKNFRHHFDYAIECIGGSASRHGINQGINIVKPGGTIALVGVAENKVPINTRDILAKGLHLIGTSRSERADYIAILPYLKQPKFQAILTKVNHRQFGYENAADLQKIFDYALNKNKYWGKIIIENAIN